MRKYNEGYTLVLVMVVLLVLCTLGAFILSFAARNLQGQVTAVDQMRDRYTAQAEIEKIVGSLEALIDAEEEEDVTLISAEGVKIKLLPEEAEIQKLEIISSCGTVRIYCVLELDCAPITGDEVVGYTVTDVKGVSYATYGYTISGGGTE